MGSGRSAAGHGGGGPTRGWGEGITRSAQFFSLEKEYRADGRRLTASGSVRGLFGQVSSPGSIRLVLEDATFDTTPVQACVYIHSCERL